MPRSRTSEPRPRGRPSLTEKGKRKCSKCKNWFRVPGGFYWNKSRNAYSSWCRGCQKKYDENRRKSARRKRST